MSDPLDRLRKNREKRERLLVERDALILEAKKEGKPVTHIADAVGLDRTQVHRIVAPHWFVFFEWPNMPQGGSQPVMTVQELEDGSLPTRLHDPVDVYGAPMVGEWVYTRKDPKARVAIYERFDEH